MKESEIEQLYDEAYARDYETRFLTSDLARPDTEHEIALLSRWLTADSKWLDVACGTGFHLSRFPHVERAGLDLSADMLRIARQNNPGAVFCQGTYLDPHPEWIGRWDLVSCMWYAYGLAGSMDDLHRLVANLASWTAPSGRCFVPLADPELIAGIKFPENIESPWPGTVSVSAIVWSYSEDDGARVHVHQLAPRVEYMQTLFGRYFREVTLETYPPAFPGWQSRRALVASAKLV